MLIEVLQHGDVCVLRLRGRSATGADLIYLEDKLHEIRNHSASKMLVDLSGLTSIGSTGLGFIVSVFRSVVSRPYGRFIVAGPTPRVRKVLDVTRLSEIIPITADVDSALLRLRGGYLEFQAFGARSGTAAY